MLRAEEDKNDKMPRFEPKMGEEYFSIDIDGNISERKWDNSQDDIAIYNFGNCFETAKEAALKTMDVHKVLMR